MDKQEVIEGGQGGMKEVNLQLLCFYLTGILTWVLCGDSKHWHVVAFAIILEGCK